ncbi:uncharacterized protein LOC127866470 isoform X1 [Dreissena polymorpha]|uniref:uncharacterized protein LOC127866470 isoform X1 n=1 Tax=Dreissena polymorpha TaxID=45954 RepID=UPI002264D880|nr:uncharacterized protein LOC127866470 isoform X1 [Dreissena polymorpha]XP_052262953.1 uncharacterized protein LOC127866470 isoform X1 [Dreissena polymorpha]XP_052262956.1 uncharacterized protein LOC127866470 isoform X1 [Dreissena polymorpha]
MDTQRGRGDTGVGGQQTIFHPLVQRDQADTRLDIQQTTFHPDDTPLTLENRNKHALHNPVDAIHLTAVQHERAPCSFKFRREGYNGSRAAHDRRSPYPYEEFLDRTRSEFRQLNQHNSHVNIAVNIATEFPFVSGLSNRVCVPAAHLQPHPSHSVYRNIFSHKGRHANVDLAIPLWPNYGGRPERPEPPYPCSADGDHERPRSSGDRTDGGLETKTISVPIAVAAEFSGSKPQSRDTSMPDFSSSSDSKHSSGSESEDHKPNMLSKKSRGDSPTVSSTVTASHQDSRRSPPAQR